MIIKNLLPLNNDTTEVTMDLKNEEIEYLLTTVINLLINKGSMVLHQDEESIQGDLFEDVEGTMQ
jgi:hypothetical protein